VTYAVIPFVVLAVCLWLGRRLTTVLVIFAYLTIEGFLKLASNYDRFVHVGSDVVVLGVAAWWTAAAVLNRRAGIPRQPWVRLIALFVVWVGLQFLNPYNPGLVPSLASLKMHVAAIPLYFIVPAAVRERRDVLRLLVALAVLACVPYVAALAQYTLGPASVLDLSQRAWQNISMYHEWRPFGTSAVPGGAATFGFLLAPLALALLAVPGLAVNSRVAALCSLLLAAGGFIVSGVRQTLLAAVLAMLVLAGLLATRGRARGVTALVMALLLGAGVFVTVQTVLTPISAEAVARDPRSPDIWRTRDATQRVLTLARTSTYLEARRGGLGMIAYRAGRFPFGAGLGRTGSGAGTLIGQITADPRSAQTQREIGWADNYYADIIVEAGIPGLLMMVAIMVGMLATAAKLARRAADPLVAAVAAALAGIFFSFLVMSWGSQPLMGNPTLSVFWAYAGLLAALLRIEREAAPLADTAAAGSGAAR